MDLEQFKVYAKETQDFEIRVIALAGSRCYQIELQDASGERHMLTRRGKPVLFRTLDDVYLELKRYGIHRAFLVQHDAHDEMVGSLARYNDPLTSRMPLVF